MFVVVDALCYDEHTTKQNTKGDTSWLREFD